MPEAPPFSTLTPGFMDDPYPAYSRLRALGPVSWSDAEGAWLVCGHQEACAVLSDPGFKVVEVARVVEDVSRAAGRSVPDLGSILAATLFLRNPPDHGEARRYLVEVLGGIPLPACAPMIAGVAERLLDRADREGHFDAVLDYADLLPAHVMGELLGITEPVVGSLLAAVSEVLMCLDRGRSPRFYARVDRTVAQGAEVMVAEVEARRREPRPDGLTRMVALADAGFGLDDREVAFRALFLMLAGIETTSALVGSAIRTVLERPEVVSALGEDPSRFDDAVEEVLRFDGPVQQASRVAGRALALGGASIRPGDRVVALVGAANRDPAVYQAPDEFRIGRPGPANLAFGRGLHHCPGGRLARLEARVALERLLLRRPRPGATGPGRWWGHRTLRRLKSYPVVLEGAGGVVEDPARKPC